VLRIEQRRVARREVEEARVELVDVLEDHRGLDVVRVGEDLGRHTGRAQSFLVEFGARLAAFPQELPEGVEVASAGQAAGHANDSEVGIRHWEREEAQGAVRGRAGSDVSVGVRAEPQASGTRPGRLLTPGGECDATGTTRARAPYPCTGNGREPRAHRIVARALFSGPQPTTMKTTAAITGLFSLALASATSLRAQSPALTIYNQNFAVVRERVPLDLAAGTTDVAFAGVTVHLEPDSVVLRDPTGKVAIAVLEQNHRADTISQGLLLSLHEGKEIDFLLRKQDGTESIVRGKVIRSGYVPNTGAAQRYGHAFYQAQAQLADYTNGAGSPIVEVEGKLRFSLPGEPIFPALSDDAILKPTLHWRIASPQAAKLDAELSYVTGGMSWEASYNLIAPEKGSTMDIVGWVTIDNQSGKTFDNAVLKLMAGDVNKLQPEDTVRGGRDQAFRMAEAAAEQQVTEKAFDEFHLYSLPRQTTLRNRQTKQVEFVRATGVKTATIYVYDGAFLGNYRGWNLETIRNQPDYGTQSHPKVWVMREFENTETNGLGIPLPRGKTRFYRRDDADGRLEFTGENVIDHTPKNERVRIYTGDAFDVVGERKRTDYQLHVGGSRMEEAFEIRVRNRKTEPIEVRVAEKLYRWLNWNVIQKSHEFVKVDSQRVEFRVQVPADGETVVTYRVRYDWQ
jgi:hypothetical protein